VDGKKEGDRKQPLRFSEKKKKKRTYNERKKRKQQTISGGGRRKPKGPAFLGTLAGEKNKSGGKARQLEGKKREQKRSRIKSPSSILISKKKGKKREMNNCETSKGGERQKKVLPNCQKT